MSPLMSPPMCKRPRENPDVFWIRDADHSNKQPFEVIGFNWEHNSKNYKPTIHQQMGDIHKILGQQRVTLKMAEQRRSDFCVVFATSLWTLELKLS